MINSSGSGIQIPDEYHPMIQQSLSSPNRSITFGSIIEKRLAVKDWHKFISGVSRKDLIRDAMETESEEPRHTPVELKPKVKTLTLLAQKFNQFGSYIESKINADM